MARSKNRNIVIIKQVSELQNEIDYINFRYRNRFSHICNLIPNKERERLDIETIDSDSIDKNGLVYVFTVNGKIFKIGHTITNIKKRIQSYNCGKTEYRIKGTNSTTNYFVLQSFLSMNTIVNVYAYFPDHPTYNVLGDVYQDSFPPTKRAEKIILESMDKKPIGCTQK